MSRAGVALFALCACGGGSSDPPDAAVPLDAAPPDAGPVITVDEAADCGGDPLVAGGGDHALVVASLAILILQDSRDLDGDGVPDNKLANLSGLANPALADQLADGTLMMPVEIFDRDADPDGCVKVGFYRGTCGDAVCIIGDRSVDAYLIDPASLEDGVPISRFRDGRTEVGGEVRLVAERGFVRVPVPIDEDQVMELPLTGFELDAELAGTGADTALLAGRLDGVLQAFMLDRQRGLSLPDVDVPPTHSYLDVMFANVLGPILALETNPSGCRMADVDLDDDGLEAFCDSDPDDADKRVDLCIDGDGTMVLDAPGVECTEAIGPDGPRFVDGISAGFGFTAEPALDLGD